MKKIIYVLMVLSLSAIVFGFTARGYTQTQINNVDLNDINMTSMGCKSSNGSTGIYHNENGTLTYYYVYTCLDIYVNDRSYFLRNTLKFASFPLDEYITCVNISGSGFCKALYKTVLLNQVQDSIDETKERVQSFQEISSYYNIHAFFRNLDIFK